MTLGTNASIQEQVRYAPHELSLDFILDELKELEEWRELCVDYENSPQDVKERIDDLETDVKDKGEEIEALHSKIDDLENEVETLRWNLEQALEPRPNQA